MSAYKIKVQEHQVAVRRHLNNVIGEFWCRYQGHDKSKLEEPEFSIFDKHFSNLSKHEYGSSGYLDQMKLVQEATAHHYSVTRHHPESFHAGVNGMSLIDLIEMLCDWLAATSYGPNGNIQKSIEFNTQRFGLSDQMVCVFKNTASWLEECAAAIHRRSAPDDQEGDHAEAQTETS
jgi:hypothetical protein